MPGGDRTGPVGMGPMSGRGAGFCAGAPVPGYMNPGAAYGRGMGYSRGGRGYRRLYSYRGFPAAAHFGFPGYGTAYMPVQPAVDEKELLSSQAEYLENQLQLVKKLLKECVGDAE